MSNHEFENYLKLIGKLLQLTRGQQASISVELRDHLESRVAELVDDGVGQQEAVSRAIEEFGDAAIMAKNFQFVSQLKRRRWMMRFTTLSMAGLFMVAVLTMAMWPTKARFGTPDTALAQLGVTSGVGPQEIGEGPSAASQLDEQMEQKFNRPVTLIYDQIPWREIEAELEEQFGINIVLDQSAIDDSLTADEPITVNLRDVPLEHGLIMMLKQKNATFIVDHGVMVVISLDNAADSNYLQMKMYDCRELLAKLVLEQSSKVPQRTPQGTSPGPAGGMFNVQSGGTVPGTEQGLEGGGMDVLGMGGVLGLFDESAGIATQEDLLIEVLQSMVYPDKWKQNGGVADARIVNGILIVKQDRQGISEVDRFLQDLNFFVNSQPGKAKFPVGADATAKEPTPGAVSNPEAQDEISTGATNDK